MIRLMKDCIEVTVEVVCNLENELVFSNSREDNLSRPKIYEGEHRVVSAYILDYLPISETTSYLRINKKSDPNGVNSIQVRSLYLHKIAYGSLSLAGVWIMSK